ncbi:MAG: hypothetical protein HC917_25025 [Richelia sp. SM2_1_7]|nr:hypothetical protein [Richelia sp. SM2_1_7]
MIARTDEIEQRFTRYKELETVLPLLSYIIEQRQRIIDNESQIEKLNQNYQSINNDFKLVSTEKDELNNQIEKIKQEIENRQNDSNYIANRLVELTPLVEKLLRLEEIQVKLQELEQTLAAFPSDLEELLQQAESEGKRLEEIEKTLPWLKLFAQARSKLVDVIRREKEANQNLESLQDELKEYQAQQEKLNTDIVDAREIEKNYLTT